MTKLEKSGKGIVLMHDFQKHTAGTAGCRARLKAGGYKVVQMKAKTAADPAEYYETLVKDMKLPVRAHTGHNVVQRLRHKFGRRIKTDREAVAGRQRAGLFRR